MRDVSRTLATDVTEQQTVALKRANVFSVALDERIDKNDNPRLAIVARHCTNGEVLEEICCKKPGYGATKGKEILERNTHQEF